MTKPKITTISDEEAEKCDFLVCVLETDHSPFTDNLVGICCKCGRRVKYRWHAPRKPKRICVGCITKKIEEDHNATQR